MSAESSTHDVAYVHYSLCLIFRLARMLDEPELEMSDDEFRSRALVYSQAIRALAIGASDELGGGRCP